MVELGERHLDDLLTIADPLVVTDLPTLLWSPHGHHEAVDELLRARPGGAAGLGRRARSWRDALERARALARATPTSSTSRGCARRPGASGVAAAFDPPAMRAELRAIASAGRPPPPGLDRRRDAARRLAGLAPGLGAAARSIARGRRRSRQGARASRRRGRAARSRAAPEHAGARASRASTIETASGRALRLDRGPGGLRARTRDARRAASANGRSRAPRAARRGVLGEGIRQALLRDPTYLPGAAAPRATRWLARDAADDLPRRRGGRRSAPPR